MVERGLPDSTLLRGLNERINRSTVTPTNTPAGANSLVADKTQPGAPASIAVGFALAAQPVGVERSWMTRAEAAERTRAVPGDHGQVLLQVQL